jgi:transmembrane sensor
MKPNIPVELLEKYLNGSCSEDEVALIKQWYRSFDNDYDHVSGLSEADEKAMEERIYNRITEKIEVDVAPAASGRAKYASLFKWSAAAAVAAFLIGGIYFFNLNKNNSYQVAQTAQKTVEEVDITNNSNQVYKAVLPDNSIIWLHPGSNIHYPKAFAANARIISMYGEAFFQITKNPKRPFIINGRSIITKVWGTSFLIRDKYRSKTADVSVVTGKVSVSIKKNEADNNFTANLEKNELLLYPNQKAIYLLDQHLLRAAKIIKEPALKQWVPASTSFDNRPLREIVPVLNATYGVNIKLGNERLGHYMLTADFDGFNLPEVLAALKKSINVNYEIKDDIIELN